MKTTIEIQNRVIDLKVEIRSLENEVKVLEKSKEYFMDEITPRLDQIEALRERVKDLLWVLDLEE